MQIRVVVSGRHYEIAQSMPGTIELPDGSTIDNVLRKLSEFVPEGRSLSPTCLVAVSGVHLGTIASHPPKPVADGDEVVIIAPVAGG